MAGLDNGGENDGISPTSSIQMGYFEESIPVRGVSLSLASIEQLYIEMNQINKKFGAEIISKLKRDDSLDSDQWERYKSNLLDDAFRLTVTISGQGDQHLFGDTAEIFRNANLPKPIRSIYFTNITAWKRNSNGGSPNNSVRVKLDFGKPPILDPTNVLSEATPNESFVDLHADDITFFRAMRQVVETNILANRTRFSVFHRSFAYDVGVWLIVLPLGLLLTTYYMEKWLPIGGVWEAYRWAFFIYILSSMFLIYRFLIGYGKWAFPVNILTDNPDRSLRHRVAIGAILSWLLYKAGDVIFELLPFVN